MNEAKCKIALAVTLGEIGGVQMFLLRFALYLKEKGYDITFIIGPGDWLVNKAKEHDIKWIKLQHLRREIHPWKDLLAINELRKIFLDNHFDAVHLNSSKMGVIGSIAAHQASVKHIVYRIGGWVFLEMLPTWKKNVYIWAERITAQYKDQIICVHQDDVELAERLKIKPKNKIICIPNGIDAEQFSNRLKSRALAREELHMNPDAFVFGSISNFYPPKNIPDYIEAIASMAKTYHQVTWVLIGDGPQRKLIEEKIQVLKLEKQVKLVGEKNDASSFLPAFDAFVLPSTKEGMSWALLEAMAAGLPCIATDVGAAKWMFEGNAGLIVKPGDTQELAETMDKLISDTSLQITLGKNAKEAVKNRFPLSKTLEKNLEALTD